MVKINDNILISIVIINLNRPILGGAVLESLNNQINKNFEVILVDNGSIQPIPESIFKNLNYPITVLKFSKKLHNLQLNAALKISTGKIIFPFVADDDFFLYNTTDIIEKIFTSNNKVDFLSLGKCNLDLDTYELTYEPENKQFYSGEVFAYPARDVALAYFSTWGIGEEKPSPLKTSDHPSGIVISRELLNRTLKYQEDLCFGQFSDVPFLGMMFQTKYTFKIDLPLLLVGCNHPQDSSLMREYYGEKRKEKEKKNRFSWNELGKFLTHSPLKGITHMNLGVDNHLQILFRNGFDVNVPNDLRLEFFIRHLNEILKDDPWVGQSEIDFDEGMIELEKALNREKMFNRQEILNNYKLLKENHIRKLVGKKDLVVKDSLSNHSYDTEAIKEVVKSLSDNILSNFTGEIIFNPGPKVIDFKPLS